MCRSSFLEDTSILECCRGRGWGAQRWPPQTKKGNRWKEKKNRRSKRKKKKQEEREKGKRKEKKDRRSKRKKKGKREI